ncbi:hypothetical protein HK405_012047 [Cladochytrium tenue]|nr:hypothetical protein HK405_012047 [Cladochytrium tenue]
MPIVRPKFFPQLFGSRADDGADKTTEGTAVDVTGSTRDVEAGSAHESLEDAGEREIIEHPNEVTKDAQIGLQKAEAAALIWSRSVVYGIYAWIWVCWFIIALQTAVSSNIIYYAYADFASAPQISQAFITSSVLSGVILLPIAKILNLWGRAEGLLIFLVVYVVGLTVLAGSSGPTTFAIGYSLYVIGNSSVGFILNIFVVDTSGLRNRAFVYGFTSTPYICTAFVGSPAAQSFLDNWTWQWSYGIFAIAIFVAVAPLIFVFKFYERKAAKSGLLDHAKSSGRTLWQSFVYFFHEFDVVGSSILVAAFILILLPFSLEVNGYSGYSSATFIAPLVVGVVLLLVFALWERYFASTQFIKWGLFKNRTVVGASVLAAVIFFSYYIWDQYFYYYVQVVYDYDTTITGYVTQGYSSGSPFFAFLFGIYIRQTKYFKNACLYLGVPISLLGAGLLIYFRGSEAYIGYLVMAQIFIALGNSILIIGDDMAVMAASDHDGIPMLIAIISLWGTVGGAIGNAVATAIYTNTFPQALLSALPNATLSDFEDIYLGGSAVQMLYPPGDPTRDAINYAWAYSQKYECIVALAAIVLAFPAVAVWKNHNVDRKQVKGTTI